MSKIVTAAEACEIGKQQAERATEDKFLHIMGLIASYAKNSNVLELADRVNGSGVYENDIVEFLQSHPEQVQRLVNMGYEVEQEIDDQVPVSWHEREEYTVHRGPFGWFGPSIQTRVVEKQSVVTVRKFTITWECEECNDERDEATV